jgi:hypothetical protein
MHDNVFQFRRLQFPDFLSVINGSKNKTGYSFWHMDQETKAHFDCSGAASTICFFFFNSTDFLLSAKGLEITL